jgi:hypothetical protein
MLLLLLLLHDVHQYGVLLWLLPLPLHCLLPLLVPLPEARVVLLHQALKQLFPMLKHSQHRWHITALRIAAAPQPLAAADTTASAVDNKIRLLLLLLLLQHYVLQSCVPLRGTHEEAHRICLVWLILLLLLLPL